MDTKPLDLVAPYMVACIRALLFCINFMLKKPCLKFPKSAK